ncbi:MAG: restriction endonuclease [Saprospiraceae bacterium]|uniref:Restriction endonuclease n=1 Tax=Candidatus Opimibacter skivensis TaxID=2982028 RepID=A0A9D7SQ76_9BACT|nr:restriction endonuclease [Candidatus Opimibacter skivensis]
MKRNPNSPWNPANICDVTPAEYEQQVFEWLQTDQTKIEYLEITRLEKLSGSGGEYEIDCVARFEVFHGAKITIIIECKRYTRPVEREKVLALYSKMLDVGAQKAMMFSTSGFQMGAIEYSKDKAIALITFIQGDWLYENRSMFPDAIPPSYLRFPKYAGIYNYMDKSLGGKTVNNERKSPITEFLLE